MESKNMYCYKYPHPAVTTDCVIFGFDGEGLDVLLIERGSGPYKGRWAFPGGFLNMDETSDEGARRELFEETGLENVPVEQFHTFTRVNRDPRERVISIAYYALVKIADVRGGDDASDARWFPVMERPLLAFDHEEILDVALKRLKERICFEPVGFNLLPEEFTMSELRTLYEAILGVRFDRRNFCKKMLNLGFLDRKSRPENAPSRVPVKYSFNKDKYDEFKKKGFFKLEF